MRLKPEYISAICKVFHSYSTSPYKLYLYGSRADDSLKGGDIDLLVLTSETESERLFEKKYKILADIKNKIGEQRIDLLIKDTSDQEPFIQEALLNAVLLDHRE